MMYRIISWSDGVSRGLQQTATPLKSRTCKTFLDHDSNPETLGNPKTPTWNQKTETGQQPSRGWPLIGTSKSNGSLNEDPSRDASRFGKAHTGRQTIATDSQDLQMLQVRLLQVGDPRQLRWAEWTKKVHPRSLTASLPVKKNSWNLELSFWEGHFPGVMLEFTQVQGKRGWIKLVIFKKKVDVLGKTRWSNHFPYIYIWASIPRHLPPPTPWLWVCIVAPQYPPPPCGVGGVGGGGWWCTPLPPVVWVVLVVVGGGGWWWWW